MTSDERNISFVAKENMIQYKNELKYPDLLERLSIPN